MQKLIDLTQNNQSFLMKRILEYAKLHGYTKYTSTLEEAWAASISGLTSALKDAVLSGSDVPELEVDHDFYNNAISTFGVLEAQKHRYRGVSLKMFLSLMKYYRQAYLDLVEESVSEVAQLHIYQLWINRFFDHNEIAYIDEWATQSAETLLEELQLTNLYLTNEKNKYLTIFESTPNPGVILDSEHRCINMNYAAQQILQANTQSPGSVYYANTPKHPAINDVLPWLNQEYFDFNKDNMSEANIEKEFDSPSQGKRTLDVKFRKMLDVSGKFDGTVITFNDLTDYKIIAEKLRHMSFHDQLTGLYNRTYMEEKIIQLVTGRFNPVGFISIDVDGLKLVNDNLGHATGDTLLVNVSRILKKSFGESDTIVRMGGDEFGIIMPLSTTETIQQACQKIKENTVTYNEMNSGLPISISIGWSVGNLHLNCNILEVIKEADSRMYEAKKTNHSKYEIIFKERLIKYGDKMVW